MIAIFPKGPFSVLPPIVYLARPSCNQLHCLGDNICLRAILDEKDVV